jgi:hypothetical protein
LGLPPTSAGCFSGNDICHIGVLNVVSCVLRPLRCPGQQRSSLRDHLSFCEMAPVRPPSRGGPEYSIVNPLTWHCNVLSPVFTLNPLPRRSSRLRSAEQVPGRQSASNTPGRRLGPAIPNASRAANGFLRYVAINPQYSPRPGAASRGRDGMKLDQSPNE